jgi:hypothetical protein
VGPATTATATSTTAIRIEASAALFIPHLISSVIYHADRDKGKCDFTRRKADRDSSKRSPGPLYSGQAELLRDCVDGEFSSILASALSFSSIT